MPCDSSHGFRNYPIHSYINPVSMPKMMGRGECICFGAAEVNTETSDKAPRVCTQAKTGCISGDALKRKGREKEPMILQY